MEWESSLAVCYLVILDIVGEFSCCLLPHYFGYVIIRRASVADLMQFTNGVLHWDLHFAQAIQDWELESIMTFMDTIYGFRFRGIGEDKMC